MAKVKNKIKEILRELDQVFLKKYKLTDFFLPPLAFLAVSRLLNLSWALIFSVFVLLGIFAWRLLKGESLIFILIGLIGVLVAFGYAWFSASLVGFFLPDIITDGLVAMVCLISLGLKKPLVAYTSWLSRRWPLNWYWHPRIRPAYSEVTFFWSLFFTLKFVLGLVFFNQQRLENLALANILTGWPGIILLLVISYLYGQRRLRNLKGPSVKEFKKNQKPPWHGQKKGF